MLRPLCILATSMFALSVPASAEYYIVHGPDHHCQVVERYEPREREIVRIGPLSLGTREEAERQVKVLCDDRGYYREEEHREHRD